MRETNGSIESFVGIVISETDLKFNCLNELTLLASCNKFADGLLEELRADFTHQLINIIDLIKY